MSGAIQVAYAGLLDDAATTVYTFVGRPGISRARLQSALFCNTDSAARGVTLRIVPAGETITDSDWTILSAAPLAASGEKESTLLLADDATDEGSLFMINGDRLVAFASVADVVAARISVVEFV